MEASPHRAISEDTRAQVSLVLRHSGIQAHTLTFHGTTCNLRDQGRMPLDCAMIQWHGQGKWIPLCFHLGISRETLSSLMSNLLVILSLFHTKNRYSELLDLLPRPLSLIPQLVPKRIYICLQNDMQNAIKWKLTEWGKQERLNNKVQQTHLIWTLTGGGLTSKLMQLLAAHPSLSKGTSTDSLLCSLRQATLFLHWGLPFPRPLQALPQSFPCSVGSTPRGTPHEDLPVYLIPSWCPQPTLSHHNQFPRSSFHGWQCLVSYLSLSVHGLSEGIAFGSLVQSLEQSLACSIHTRKSCKRSELND